MRITTSLRRLAVVAGGSAAAVTLVAGAAIGAGADPIIGTGHGDDLHGTARADVIKGLGGDDWAYGKAGADQIGGGGGDDYPFGGKGADVLRGGPGDDSFIPGGALDRVRGGDGRDVVYLAKDHRADRVSCGSGRDKVYGVTSRDEVAKDCEFVTSETPSCRIVPSRGTTPYAEPARCRAA
jgi:Ca2+-binding RTX toxin-like protein